MEPAGPPRALEMSASGSRRKRRSRGRRDTSSDPCNLMELDTSLDLVDTLALKYMKCKVDSSTDSESDINTEGFTSMTTQEKKSVDLSLQFLDPYDGDSEETSTHSDGSSNSQYLFGNSDIHTLVCSIQNQAVLGDVSCEEDVCMLSEKQESFSPFIKWDSPSLEASDVFVQSLPDLGIAFGTITAESSGCSLDSSILTGPSGFSSSQFMLLTMDPLQSPDQPVMALLHEQKRKSEISSEFTSKSSVAKRKLGMSIFDYNGEKLIKKQCVAERKTFAKT
uniref:Uncharacterized protein LOC117363381 isoform X1 n=1 Tax=Geotrypetes seraphini TaxID=260995 RepID=A0A6P8RNE9_GEOSA|nr:uncharacterized protein LOC117363381 isoform X1 [Geotrypetes seraphini]